jgi:pimeloyl-ACP methyl ester carboxylesterase
MTESETQNIITKESYNINSLVGEFLVIEVSPTRLKTNIPVVIAPGWSEPANIFEPSQSVIARKGRKSLCFDHPRLGGKVEPNSNYSTPELRKARALLDLIDNTGSDKVDIMAHSEGAVYTVIAASLEPEKFRNMVLIGPAGMIGQDTLTALLGRFSKKIARNLAQAITDPKTTKKIALAHAGAAQYIAKNPLRALKEAVAISKSNIHEMLPKLRSQGIGIVIIHHTDDEAFPMHRIQQVAKTEQVDGILAVTGLHDDLCIYPEKYTAVAEEMLSALEKKQAKKK